MAFARVPGWRKAPGVAATAGQPELHQPQQRLRHHLDLERAQHRLLGPGPTFFHSQPLLVIPNAVFLPKPSAVGRENLGRRQIAGTGNGRPQLVVARHFKHVGVHDFFRAADRPATAQTLVAERAHAAVDVGPACLPGHVPLRVLLRRGQALSPFARAASLRILRRRRQGSYSRASFRKRVTNSIRRPPWGGFRQGAITVSIA